jgi:adenylate cyclase
MTQLAVVTPQGQEVRSHSGYRLIIEPARKRVRAVFNGETVADSERVLVMHETGYRPVTYVPREDVRMDLLQPTDLHTHCPFKGDASYWTLEVGGRRVENAAWSYEDPYEEAEIVRGHIAFYWDRVDAWFEDGEHVAEPPPPITAATANPLLDWVTREAWQATTAQELIERLALRLVAADFPLWRLRLLIRTLHPQLFATAFTWQSDRDGVETSRRSHAVLESRAYLDSPFVPILRGEGGVRRRLEGPQPKLDYPVLQDLHAEGATDYVAMPLRFSDGQINIIMLVSGEGGGFSTAQLGLLYEILPVLSRLFEVFALQDTAATLLGTYLGRRTGSEVLNGLIRRGDGRDIDAAIWLCDLRDSTVLSESMAREAYLESLNQFFDCMVEPIVEHGGEVLKYVGDSVLAIFPIEEPDSPAHEACARALAAAADAHARVEQLNLERAERGEPPLGYGIGLHRGCLTYGNIGSSERLDFTVIGTAVNEAARLEDMTKILGEPVLISSAFAASFGGKLTSLGQHRLRGVALPQEIFTA